MRRSTKYTLYAATLTGLCLSTWITTAATAQTTGDSINSSVAMAAFAADTQNYAPQDDALQIQPGGKTNAPASKTTSVGNLHSEQTQTNNTNSQTITIHAHSSVHSTPSHSASAASGDLMWLARAIEAEAGGEPQATKVAVGDVIMNRVRSPKYPNSIHAVLFQVVAGKYAFTCVQNGMIYGAPSNASMDAAKKVLYRRENIVPGALVFYANSKTPANSWVRKREVIQTFGDMYFAQ